MAAAGIVAAVVRAALPDGYCVREGQFTFDDPQDRGAAVYPLGGGREEWGVGGSAPRIIRDRVRVRLRAKAGGDCADWLAVMSDRLRYAVLATYGYPATRGRVYFSPSTWHDGVTQTWTVVRIMTDSAPRLTEGRRYSLMDTDYRVIMRPLARRPMRVPWAWASPLAVYEASGQQPPAEVQRTAVGAGRVLVGGRLTFTPTSRLNPPDDPFPDGAPQGAFPGAAPGEVLWRDTSVATRTTGSGGSREVNLFDGSLDDIPHQTGGASVRLLKVVLNANDTVSIVTRDRFDPGLEANGIFFWRIVGGQTYSFPLGGEPVKRVGDNHYDVTPPPVEGFRTATAEAATLGDWAFVDGREWETEPHRTEPPASPRWTVRWELTDGAGNPLRVHETIHLPDDGGRSYVDVQPVAAAPTDGALVQRVTVRDASTPPITRRGRYALAVSADGLVLHGETDPDAPAVQPEPAPGRAFDAGFGPEFG